MSKEHRNKALAIIRKAIEKKWSPSHLLRRLTSNGYTSELVRVDDTDDLWKLAKEIHEKHKADCGPECISEDDE